MKISRDGVIPQLEPEGKGRRWLIRLGGAKRLFQRSGIIMRPITMFGAMTSAWATYQPLQALFQNSILLFFGVVSVLIGAFMVTYYAVLISAEQAWGQTQSQRSSRSPLKRDTEAIRELLEGADGVRLVQDGGSTDDA